MCCKLHNEHMQINILLYQYFAAGRLYMCMKLYCLHDHALQQTEKELCMQSVRALALKGAQQYSSLKYEVKVWLVIASLPRGSRQVQFNVPVKCV